MDSLREEIEVDKLKHTIHNPKELNKSIKSIRSFAKTVQKNSSVQTVNAIANTMIGSSCLILPVAFNKSGIITAMITLVIIGLVSYKTCDLVIQHSKAHEKDLPEMIKRLLGKRWYYVYLLAGCYFLALSALIYYILMCNTLYPIICFLCMKIGGWEGYAKDDEFTFSTFSYQYVSLFTGAIVLGLSSLRDLSFIVKLGHCGVFSLYGYAIYIIVECIMNMVDGSFSFDGVVWFTWDFANLSGILALAFIVHNCIVPIIKQNRIQENNSRDLGYAYSIAGGMYSLIGILGSFAIVGKQSVVSEPHLILDYYETKDIAKFIVQIVYLTHLVSAFPVLFYIARSSFFEIFYKHKPAPNSLFWTYNIINGIIVVLFGIFRIPPDAVISFTGAVVGFLLAYMIPISLHFSCIYNKGNIDYKINKCEVIRDTNKSDLEKSKLKEQLMNETVNSRLCKHGVTKVSIAIRVLFYSIILMIGFALMIIQLYQLFSPLFTSK